MWECGCKVGHETGLPLDNVYLSDTFLKACVWGRMISYNSPLARMNSSPKKTSIHVDCCQSYCRSKQGRVEGSVDPRGIVDRDEQLACFASDLPDGSTHSLSHTQ